MRFLHSTAVAQLVKRLPGRLRVRFRSRIFNFYAARLAEEKLCFRNCLCGQFKNQTVSCTPLSVCKSKFVRHCEGYYEDLIMSFEGTPIVAKLKDLKIAVSCQIPTK